MLYGSKFDNDNMIVELGTRDELEAQGMRVFETEQEAKHYADRMEYRTLRREFNQMTLEELNSDRAKELERRIWGRNANFEDCDYVPGTIIEERKKKKIENKETPQ